MTKRHDNGTPMEPDRRRGRSWIAAVVAAGVITVSAGGALAVTNQNPAQAERRVESGAEHDLGDVTLDELADQLDALGLVVELAPADGSGTTGSEDVDSEMVDPFAGMTDAQVDALSDEEFEALLDEAGAVIVDAEEEEARATFSVSGDEIRSEDASPELTAEAEAIWKRFTDLIPADQRQMVVGFELLSTDFGGAYVYPSDDDPTKWVLGVGPAPAGELDEILVHEFGHLLTLRAGEVPPSDNADSCTTYYTGEGCALSGSTFARFVEKFWPQELIDEIGRIQESGDMDAAEAFYDKHRDEFVTDYATTNPGEDLAETFAAFVLGDRPSGDTVADQKVQFLWEDPAMKALRAQIRANMES